MNILERLERNSSEQRQILSKLWAMTRAIDSEFIFTFHGHYGADRYSVTNEHESHYAKLNDGALEFFVPGEQSQGAIEFVAELNNKIGDL